MYIYHKPTPIHISLIDETGFSLRELASNYVKENFNKTGAERGSQEEQSFGALAEIVIRHDLKMPEINPVGHPLGYDILLPSGVKVDVKCRGGAFPFKEVYTSTDGINREAKHNLWARQLFDDKIDADIFLLTHLETPKVRTLPGSRRQRKWNLYICGWVSKSRAKREGVYLPRGSLTEQGNTWFTYRGQEVEFYNKNLNGLGNIEDLLTLSQEDVDFDVKKFGGLNLTNVDSVRIAYDLAGRGIISSDDARVYTDSLKLQNTVKPILHPNQYFHLLRWLIANKQLDETTLDRASKILTEETFTEI